MKIILLDFDDVMNSQRTAACWGWGPSNRDGSQVFNNIDDPRLDPVAVALIRKLCESTNAKIVLSTTWRNYYSIQAFIDMFSKYYDWHDAPVIDKTQRVRITSSRECEIVDYLEDHSEITHYVILDNLYLRFTKNFVRINGNNGLTYENYLDALEILEGEPSGNSVFV
jgi:HAD domain in Swiss Army Knife RNA repair proteins